MIKPAKLSVQRRSAGAVKRSPAEVAELKSFRRRFQRYKPTLAEVLAASGQTEAMPLGDYLQIRELLHDLQIERKRQ